MKDRLTSPALSPEPGDTVSIGLNSPIEAVVCQMMGQDDGSGIEVVYFNGAGQAVHEQAHWTGSHWAFSGKAPSQPVQSNAYARLRPYLALLRLRGRGSF